MITALRVGLLEEALAEFKAAVARGDVVEMVDALSDARSGHRLLIPALGVGKRCPLHTAAVHEIVVTQSWRDI